MLQRNFQPEFGTSNVDQPVWVAIDPDCVKTLEMFQVVKLLVSNCIGRSEIVAYMAIYKVKFQDPKLKTIFTQPGPKPDITKFTLALKQKIRPFF